MAFSFTGNVYASLVDGRDSLQGVNQAVHCYPMDVAKSNITVFLWMFPIQLLCYPVDVAPSIRGTPKKICYNYGVNRVVHCYITVGCYQIQFHDCSEYVAHPRFTVTLLMFQIQLHCYPGNGAQPRFTITLWSFIVTLWMFQIRLHCFPVDCGCSQSNGGSPDRGLLHGVNQAVHCYPMDVANPDALIPCGCCPAHVHCYPVEIPNPASLFLCGCSQSRCTVTLWMLPNLADEHLTKICYTE